MSRLLIIAFFLLTRLAVAQDQWLVDSSSVSFQIKNAGINVQGSFSGLEARINFNPKKLKRSSIEASVDASTVDTGIRIRNKHLLKADFFHAGVYPRIKLSSHAFQKKQADQFEGAFKISLKGSEKIISIPFTFENQGQYGILSGIFEIDRQDFDLGGKSLLLADNVQVNIWVKVKKE